MHNDYIIHCSDGSVLQHYGVLGMKWGHRKQKEVRKKILSSGYPTVNRDRVSDKIFNEIYKTEAFKNHQNMSKKGVKISNGRTYMDGDLISNKKDADEVKKIIDDRNSALSSVISSSFNKHADELASAALKDIGEEETPEAHSYVKKILY